MTCKQFLSYILDSHGELTHAARDHIRQCPACALIAGRIANTPPGAVSDELEQRILKIVTADLRPVTPLRPAPFYWLLLVAVAAMVATAGLLVLGHRGWDSATPIQKTAVGGIVVCGLLISGWMLVRSMRPGVLVQLRPASLVALVLCLLVAAGMLYPLVYYAQFPKAFLVCFAIGLGHAIPTLIVTLRVLRLGFVTSPVSTSALAALFSGLTGLFVLYVFCPHLDAGHYLLAHVGMVAACVAASPAIARWLRY
jgi:hypothetical protein